MKINISSLLTNPPFENLRVGILGENFIATTARISELSIRAFVVTIHSLKIIIL